MKKAFLSDCPVPCLQNETELQRFIKFISKIPLKKVVEIGTFFGGTMWYFLQHAAEIESFTSIDLPIPAQDDRYTQMVSCRNLWTSWFSENQTLIGIAGNSRSEHIIGQARAAHPQNDVDMLFIDGDHTYHGVRADFDNYRNLVKPGGYIVFHDIIGIADVWQCWSEIVHDLPEECYFVIQDENATPENPAWGIGILQV